MSERRMPNCPASASKGFSSTPVKNQNQGKTTSKGLDDDVVSDDEDTFSLLSPIYHDSFDSDDEDLELPARRTSSRQSDDSRLCSSSVSCELPKTPLERISSPAVQPADNPSLGAWQVWLLNKAREDRLKMEKKAEEERLLKEKKEQQERELEQKKMVMEEKIQEWLQIKREQEKQQQVVKQRKEEEETQRQQEKQRKVEQKARQKYRDWLQKKNEEEIERQKKEKEETALKEELEKERRRRAEVKFKEWLVKANEKSRTSPKTPSYTANPYSKAHPAPSFYNPIPWKPIHTPAPEAPPNQTSCKKPQKQRKSQPSSRSSFRTRNTLTAAQLLQRR